MLAEDILGYGGHRFLLRLFLRAAVAFGLLPLTDLIPSTVPPIIAPGSQ